MHLTRADGLLTRLRAGEVALPPAPARAPRRASRPPSARLRQVDVPRILLGLGALCLLVAAVTFLAVAWSWLGVGGRTGVLLALTAATSRHSAPRPSRIRGTEAPRRPRRRGPSPRSGRACDGWATGWAVGSVRTAAEARSAASRTSASVRTRSSAAASGPCSGRAHRGHEDGAGGRVARQSGHRVGSA